MIEKGFCQCGCGGKTRIADYNRKSFGWIKGEPIKFIQGHHSRVIKFNREYPRFEKSFHWKGGRIIDDHGYILIKIGEHPRTHNGYVKEHILMAEKALGRPIPKNIPVHHYPQKPSSQLVICQDKSYHHLLHRRYRAFKACGHASWMKCEFCHKWDDPINLHIAPKKQSRAWHRQCSDDYRLRKRLLRKNAI